MPMATAAVQPTAHPVKKQAVTAKTVPVVQQPMLAATARPVAVQRALLFLVPIKETSLESSIRSAPYNAHGIAVAVKAVAMT